MLADSDGGPRGTGSGPWFKTAASQAVTSEASNSIESKHTAPIVYRCEDRSLPYPPIPDNTEGIPAFTDIVDMFPDGASLIVDVGGGAFGTNKEWVENHFKGKTTMLVADPFRRTREHNEKVQLAVERAKGADVVTSMSVLNVIPTLEGQLEHVRVCFRALRPGGLAFFKVWAGSWPKRGTGEQEIDEKRGVCQNNKWASDFLPAVIKVFGKGAKAFADNNSNLIVVRRSLKGGNDDS